MILSIPTNLWVCFCCCFCHLSRIERAAVGLSKSPAGARRVWQAFAETARRVRGKKLCSLLRNRRNATLHLAQTRQYSETPADSRRCVQYQPGAAQDVGCRHAARADKPRSKHGFAPLRVPHQPILARKHDSIQHNHSFRPAEWKLRRRNLLQNNLKMARYTIGWYALILLYLHQFVYLVGFSMV
jgi:hypothetical protein